MGAHIFDPVETQLVVDALRRIVQALRESSRWAEGRLGLSGAQLFVLQTLVAGPASVNELARRTCTHQSSVSTVVARLVESGLVRRERSETDGRSVRLSLSPRGRRLAGRAPDVPQLRLIDAVDRLPRRRRRELAGSLDEVAAALGDTRRTPEMFFHDQKQRKGRRV